MSISIDNANIQVAENSELVVSLDIKNAVGGVSVAVSDQKLSEWLSVDYKSSSRTLNIAVTELLNEQSAQVTIEASDTRGSDSIILMIEALNTSATDTLDDLKVYAIAASDYHAQTEELEFASLVIELAEATNPNFDIDIGNQLITELEQTTLSTLVTPLTDSLSMIEAVTAQYHAGDSSEQELDNTLSSVKHEVSAYTAAVNDVLSQIQSLATVESLSMDTSNVYLSKDLMRLSRFVGNPALGEFKDDTWDFFPEYSFLNEVVNPSALNCTSK